MKKMMNIPQVNPWFGKEEREAILEPIDNNWITEGPKSEEFSNKLNTLMKTDYGVFAPNGTLALFLGLLALNIGPGDEVLIPDSTFIASATSVVLTGAKPVFVEVNDYNFQIDISKCDSQVTPKTRAIMPVHLFGMVANMEEVMWFAQEKNLAVIEDAAQAVGVKYKGKHAGTFGDIGCFSFFADKTITTGEGGYVICNNEKIYNKLLVLRSQGRINRGSFIHPEIGFNFRITDLQAAIGIVQLSKLPKIIELKTMILSWYHQKLDSLNGIRFLQVESHSEYVPFRVVLLVDNAQDLMEFLSQNGVVSRSFFYPLHKQPCFQNRMDSKEKVKDVDKEIFPNAVYGYEHGVCLPVFPTLTYKQVSYICDLVKAFYQKG